MIALGYILSILYGAAAVLVGGLFYKLGLDKKYTRKLVHILIGGEWFVLYHTVGCGIHFFLICLMFTAALIIEYKMGLLTAISSSEDNAPGTVYYGVAMSMLALACAFVPELIYPFGVAVLCTSVGDGLGGVVGGAVKKGNRALYGTKTALGTLTVFLSSLVSIFIFSKAYGYPISPLAILEISLLCASAELVSKRGTDNLAVPLSTAVFTYLIYLFPVIESYALTLAILPLTLALICNGEALTPPAAVGAALLALVSTASLGNAGAVILLIYFSLATVTDKIKNKAQKTGQNTSYTQETKTPRGLSQVLENGISPFAFAILNIVSPSEIFAFGFVVSLAESLADTAASGIGSLADRTYFIIGFKRCDRGVDGGVSFAGTFTSLVFALILSALARIFGVISLGLVVPSTVFAFFGMLLDSLLGALLQERRRRSPSGKITDGVERYGSDISIASRVKGVTNGAVNLICSISTSFLATLIVALI